jgi:phosphatidylglycerophosphate synthase
MENSEQNPFYRKLADGLTTTRRIGGYMLAGYIIGKGSKFRSFKTSFIASGLYATDMLDGYFARKSNIESEEGTKDDEQTDKKFNRAMLAALFIATQDRRYLVYDAAYELRDQIVTNKRDVLRENELPAAARILGKIKARYQATAVILDLSPIGEKFPGFVHNVHQAAEIYSVISGADIVIDANKRLEEKRNSIISSP